VCLRFFDFDFDFEPELDLLVDDELTTELALSNSLLEL
jgi:hypothetical protein